MGVRGEDYVAVLPDAVDMGSAYKGRCCNIVRSMVSHNGMTEDQLSSALRMNPFTMHKTLRMMESDDMVFTMWSNGSRHYFLTQRPYWREQVSNMPTMEECDGCWPPKAGA